VKRKTGENLQPLKPFKITRSREKITNRIGLPLIEQLAEKLKLRKKIDRLFPKPGSNRGIQASDYVMTLVHMIIDGSLHLEDVNHLLADEGYQELLKEMNLPSSDAIGDWLRRHGGKQSEKWMWEIITEVLRVAGKEGTILDIDTTIIEAEKGDAQKTYKGIYGYQPLIGIIAENGMIAGSDFREGNISPQSGLVEFIQRCRKNYSQSIKIVRSDSAGWKKEMVDYCNKEKINFTITTDQTEAVLEAIKSIPEEQWQRGIDKEGIKEEYEVAETKYFFGARKREVRLVAKRVKLKRQYDLFLNYSYWIVATNLKKEQSDCQQVIHLHQGRGSMEKRIGELKHQLNLDHLPCGQFNANCLYFTIGLLAYNLLQLLKLIGLPEEYHTKTVRTLRYQLIKLAGKVITHARYKILQVAAPLKNIELFTTAYYRIRFAPL
jgi:hypothetical protein